MTLSQVPDDWWQMAVKVIPHPIACVDLDGRFVWANESWCNLLGYTLGELEEKTWKDLTPINDIGADEVAVQSVISGVSDEYQMQKHYITKSGKLIPVWLYVHRFPELGDVTMFVSCTEPITNTDVELQKVKEEVRVLQKYFNERQKLHEDYLATKRFLVRWGVPLAGGLASAYWIIKEVMFYIKAN